VVIVVPPFAQGNERQEPVITAVIGGWESSLSDQVCEGVNAERAVVEKHGADEEAPYEHLPTVRSKLRMRALEIYSKEERAYGEKDNRNYVVLLEEVELLVLRKVLHEVKARLKELRAQDPTDMREIDSVNDRGVDVLFSI
jgi:hypothetical protein